VSLRLSPLLRILPWFSGLVLVAGIVAVGVVVAGGDDSGSRALPAPEVVENVPYHKPNQKQAPLDPAVRQVAGQFLLTAVARENLRLAWRLSGAELRQGLTLNEWMTGNIPVPFYPGAAIDKASLRVQESLQNKALLEVAILPKAGAEVKGQFFYIELKAVGTGKKRHWVVTYIAPSTPPGAPTAGGAQ
jgi:hypothetical protein